MNPTSKIYPPKVERASRSTGPRTATAPHNEDARTGSGGECPLPINQSGEANLAHDTMDASRAVEVVLNESAALVTRDPDHPEVHCGRKRPANAASDMVTGSHPSVFRIKAIEGVVIHQLPGCLPSGYDLDSLLTVEQFAVWQQSEISTIRPRLASMKGVISHTQKSVRIHPRTYLEKTIKR